LCFLLLGGDINDNEIPRYPTISAG
jgi:hypothetical protein